MNRPMVSRILPLSLLALSAPVAWCGDSLNFFNNWFVTGDYAVAGVGLKGTGVSGFATGSISMTGVPSGAQPIAAFLYWSTVEPSSTPGASIGYFNGNKIQGAVLGNPQAPNPACTAGAFAFVYRADVLRYLPLNSSNIAQANGSQTVKLPDAGANVNGSGINTNGASLIVIYKIVTPGLPTIMPLRAVVIYNGASTMNKQSAPMTLTVAGFYQASALDAARFSSMVANGQPGFSEPLSVNGQTVSTNPFVGAQGPRWDNPSYNINLPTNAASFSAMASAGNSQTCVTWAARCRQHERPGQRQRRTLGPLGDKGIASQYGSLARDFRRLLRLPGGAVREPAGDGRESQQEGHFHPDRLDARHRRRDRRHRWIGHSRSHSPTCGAEFRGFSLRRQRD